MATEENPGHPTAAPIEEGLEGKLGDLNLEETEKFEDSTDVPVAETPEEVHESVLDELKSGTPKLHHVETVDTTDPSPGNSTDGDVVKAEVPAAFEEELKSDHNIVPSEKPTAGVETVAKEVGADAGESAPATREVPVTVTHEVIDEGKPSKIAQISEKLHKVFGRETSS